MICTIHNEPLTQRESKTKFEVDGSPKTYMAHNLPDGKLCFGKVEQPRVQQTPIVTEDKPDWDKIAEGKIRSLFIQAHITKNGIVRLNEAELLVMDELVGLAMTGK